MKFSNELKFGIFATLATAAIIYGLNFLSGSSFFGPPLKLKAKYTNLDGLLEGDPIMINGMRVGRAKNFDLNLESGDVTIELEFFEKMKIPRSSMAMIASRSVLGEKSIRIIGLEDSARRMVPGFYETGDDIPGTLETGIIDNMTNLVESKGANILIEVAKLATELRQITQQTQALITDQNNTNSLTASIYNIRETTEYLTSISKEVDSIAKQLNTISVDAGSVVQNFKGNNENISTIFENVKNTTDSLEAASDEITELLTDASTTVETITDMVGKLDTKLDTNTNTLGALINDKSLYDSLVVTTLEINSLLREAKANPQRFFDDIKLYLINRRNKDQEEAKLEDE
ncbi:MAG: MlaD family protein [Bacteroidia bacterium]|nr:MlaD family protein [Bacteroidia bacterium]